MTKPTLIDTKKFMSCKPVRSELSGFLLVDDDYQPVCEIFAMNSDLILEALKESGLKKIDHASLLDSNTPWTCFFYIFDVPSAEFIGAVHSNGDLSTVFHHDNDKYLAPLNDALMQHTARTEALKH